jgi:biopolymer transport protein ExbD
MRLPIHRRSSSFDLQMTAMIDVVFLLLIFFLWTSSFEEPEFDLASALSLPPVGNNQSKVDLPQMPFDEIVIRIVQSPDGSQQVKLNEAMIPDLSQLKTKLSAIASLGAQPAVIVHPDSAITMEMAIAVYDIARSTGFDRVLFTATP